MSIRAAAAVAVVERFLSECCVLPFLDTQNYFYKKIGQFVRYIVEQILHSIMFRQTCKSYLEPL